jgi:hypothetical protein
MDVGSRRISVSQVSREPDVARETGSGTLAPVSAMEVFAQVTGQLLSPFASTAGPAVPAASQVARVRGRSAAGPRSPGGIAGRSRPRLVRRATVSAVGPPSGRRLRSPGSGGAPPRFPDWRGCGSSDWHGSAGSAQRINGVSRLLPYSDLLALTSSSRRGEDVSDRGSWKRLRILLTGHVDAHAEPDIETVVVPYRACVVP